MSCKNLQLINMVLAFAQVFVESLFTFTLTSLLVIHHHMSSTHPTTRMDNITTKRVINAHYIPVAPESPSITSHHESVRSKCPFEFQSILCVFIAISIGVAPVFQGGVNIALSEWVGSPLRAGFINSCVGLTCLSMLLCTKCTPSIGSNHQISMKNLVTNIVTECKSEKQNLFIFCNGLLGVFFICSAIYIVPMIGFGLYTISLVSGQIITSTLIDHYGLIWSPKRRLSAFNLCGPFLAICGGVVFQSQLYLNPKNDVDPNPDSTKAVVIQILCICGAAIAGICSTVQAALNRRLTVISGGSPFQSSFISFCDGTLVLVILNVIDSALRKEWPWMSVPEVVPDWYMFCGGMIGAFVLSMFIICPSRIGFVTTYLCSIFGSMLTSVVFDYFGAFGVAVEDKGNVLIFEIIGILSVLIGAIIVNLKRGAVDPSVAIKIDDHCDPV